ncbi:MAG: hypothetical protein HUU46_16835 [Candidatus Hydrogenedentes bacterium]|nr:hypothetical protein [Candidatus Hydrogenedentota bacterium]
MSNKTNIALAFSYVMFPAVAMLLGWGLRGYIGGGPFAAMIPGVFVALGFSLIFRHDARTAAIVAMFGALGIGYGGDMTYGQTLGLAIKPETMYWGLLGVTVKGGVWGLLGGAVLGAGLVRQLYDRKTLSIAFLLTVVAFYLGWKLINEPKLIYFSDPVNKPREESWAGLLFAAAAFLGYVRAKSDGPLASLPVRFALWGALGGALGFGGGTLWMVFGPDLPVDQKWWGWWKMMEFSFGFILGAALGLCAWLNRGRCSETKEGDTPERSSHWAVVGAVAFVALMFVWAVPVTERAIDADAGGILAYVQKDIDRLVGSFILFGAVCFTVGVRSVPAAWQIALTLTFFHTVLDLVGDFTGPKPGSGFLLPVWANACLLLGATGAFGIGVARIAKRANPVAAMYLLLVWACYAVATARTFVRREYLDPGDGPGFAALFFHEHPSTFVMQVIFTVSAIVTTVYIVRLRRRDEVHA